jgi:chorismate dehydratase
MTRGWIEQRTADGSSTFAHPVHGEAGHSLDGAWTQARERYARDARIRARALELEAAGVRELRLLDVGTGLGLNLAAALEALTGTGVALRATSLEIDADVLRLAIAGPREPADLEVHHARVRNAIASALEHGTSAPIPPSGWTLELHLGDAREALGRLDPMRRFDAVFLDPFSPKVEPDLWSRAFLAAVAARMASGAMLSTYSAATAVRVGLAAAGLVVGAGGRVGRKREGTLASLDVLLPAFDAKVARRIAARARLPDAPAGFDGREGAPRGPIP